MSSSYMKQAKKPCLSVADKFEEMVGYVVIIAYYYMNVLKIKHP